MMRKIFRMGYTREQKEEIATNFTWDFVDDADLEKIPFEKGKEYTDCEAVAGMISFSEGLFKKKSSEIGFYYQDVKSVFLEQNEQLYKTIKQMKKDGYNQEGKFLVKLAKTMIVPKVHGVKKVLKEIEKWSPEEQAEALQLLAGIKIKIVVEDI